MAFCSIPFLLLLMISFVHADGDISFLITLNSNNWNEVVDKSPLILVEFYAPWCGFCKAMMPAVEQAAKILAEEDIPVAKVDAIAEGDLADDAGVESYPTFRVYRFGKRFNLPGELDEHSDADFFVSIMRKLTFPAVVPISSSESHAKLLSKASVTEPTLVAYFPKIENPGRQVFHDFAESYRDRVNAYEVTSSDLLDSLGVLNSRAKIFLLRPWASGKEFKVTYGGSFKKSYLEEWILKNAFQAIDYQPSWLEHKIEQRSKAMLYAYLSPRDPEALKEIQTDLTPSYEKYGKQRAPTLGFLVKDEIDDDVAWLDSSWAGVYMIEAKRRRYIYEKESGLTPSEWVDLWAKGKAKEFTKSEAPYPILPAKSGLVQNLAASQFEEVVLDDTKDVLVAFSASWCGFCRAMAPELKKLAKRFKSVPNLVISVIDSTQNIVTHDQYQIDGGFPTIYFAKAGNKLSPVPYEENDRGADMFETFIRTHATVELPKRDPRRPVKELTPVQNGTPDDDTHQDEL